MTELFIQPYIQVTSQTSILNIIIYKLNMCNNQQNTRPQPQINIGIIIVIVVDLGVALMMLVKKLGA